MGQIYYNTCYDDWGNVLASNLNIGIYQQKISTYTTDRDLNYMAGTAVSAIVNFLYTVFSALCESYAPSSSQVLYAILGYFGISVVNGVIQSSISKVCHIQEEEYEMSAIDPATRREFVNYGYRYQTMVDGVLMGDYHYDGYYPWNDTFVAYWWFTDFWAAYDYPGINRIV